MEYIVEPVSFTLNSPCQSKATTFPSFGSATASPFALAAAKTASVTTQSDDDEQSETSVVVGKTEETSTPRESTKAKILRQTEVKTGEEDEETIYHIKAKLFVMDRSSSNWKERGAGTLRINIRENASGKHARIVMRADTVYRVILNLPLFEGMDFLIMQEKFVRFAGFETIEVDGKKETQVVNYALKVANPSTAIELQQQLNACVSK
ncbi:hypothetical protein BX666DRAFT_73335 [Dichotomocladium elegans]|nr:hypothetical protein BX666DRAFT_73335 [Dichotomocladium elegans]